MKLILSNGERIDLPNDLDIEERKALVNRLLETYPADFSYGDGDLIGSRYGMRQDNNHLVKVRLDVLATYLIRGEPDYTETVMSNYKKQVRPQQERPFSQFHKNTIETNGWH